MDYYYASNDYTNHKHNYLQAFSTNGAKSIAKSRPDGPGLDMDSFCHLTDLCSVVKYFLHFSYFHYPIKVWQVDFQQTSPVALAVNGEIPRPPDAKQPIKTATEEKLGPTPNKAQAKDRNVTPAASLSQPEAWDATPTSEKRVEKHVLPTSSPEEEKHKGVVPKQQGGKQTEAKDVISTASQKPAEGKDVLRASSQLQLKEKNVTPPSRAKQTERTRSRHRDTAKENSNKVESLPTVIDRNVSAMTAQKVTNRVPTATPHKRFKASDYKIQPHWDFEDEYVLDNSTRQSSCPDSLRLKAAKSDWLKNVFLPNITLFMDKSHFSDSEWNRLEHFVPPFGFMELNYSLVKEVISMLPHKPYHQVLFARNSSQASRCITCAVVANGGILNNSRMGQEIDSHDYVFRVSGAVVKDYEKDVGTRTSFYGFTAYSLASSVAILGRRGFKKVPIGKEIKYLHFLEGHRDYEWLKALLLNTRVRKGFLDIYGPRPRDKFDNDFSLDKYFVIHPDVLRYMKNRFLNSSSLHKSYWRIYRPTTGAFLLLTALQLCDQVSAYGYITEGYQNYSDHYYDKEKKKLIFYSNHDFDLERRVWKKLHDENIMKLYQRS
ncbi:alpha-N-acetylgalactosaminide alpha-2,6-sialyltransferase 1 [Elgaria multicarinata webbii]|uniref:alpha-N-acetylgalactosaminide alpha-2,6-sialyltransferase 1 n=1 Tax=Elgaria multicarinata webbii TaxID=159646 RepID=UPI002FCD16F7